MKTGRWYHGFRRIGGLGARGLALCVLSLCVAAGGALAGSEAGPLLSADDLRDLQPAYEAFLHQLAEVLVARDLLSPEAREDWTLYQLGDYYQNGGYGMIAAMFTPNLLEDARPQDALLRLKKDLPGAHMLHIDTMRAYLPLDSSQPGLLLEAGVTDAQGLPVACRFRWRSGQGGFLVWDALLGRVVEVGNHYVNDGRPAYWSDQPITGVTPQEPWILQLEILDPLDDERTLGGAELALMPEGNGWALDETSLR